MYIIVCIASHVKCITAYISKATQLQIVWKFGLVDQAYDLVLVFMTSTWQRPVTGAEKVKVPEHQSTFTKIQQVFANTVYGALT